MRGVVDFLRSKQHLLALAAIVVVGAVLRAKDLTTASLWLDEFATLIQVRGGFTQMIALTAADTYPPGYNTLAWASVHLFGLSDWSLRLPALLLGIAAIPAVYWLGCVASGRVAGLIAAALTALSPFAIIHSHDARMYSLLLLASALSAAATITVVRKPTVWRCGLVVLSNVLLLYSHPYGILNWLVIGAALIAVLLFRPVSRRDFWVIASSQVVTAVAFLPWALTMLGTVRRITANGFWIPRPDVWDALYVLKSAAGGYVMSLLLLALLGVATARRSSLLRQDAGFAAAILVALAFGPWLIGFIVSQFTTPMLIQRYIAGSVPALLVLASAGAATVATSTWRRVALTIGVALFGAAAYATEPKSFGEDWRGLARYLKQEMRASDCLATNPGIGAVSLEYYMSELPPCFSQPRPLAEARIDRDTERLFVVLSHARETTAELEAKLGAGWSKSVRYFSRVELTTFTRVD